MTLNDFTKSLPGSSAEDVLAALLAEDVIRVTDNGSPIFYRWRSFIDLYGEDVIKPIADAMRVADPFNYDLIAGGIDLSNDKSQDKIDKLVSVGLLVDGLGRQIKALGVIRRPKWQSLGIATEPTLEEVQTAQRVSANQATLSVLLAHIANEIANPAIADPDKMASDTAVAGVCDAVIAACQAAKGG